jgi:uncharacterized membrane protein
LSALTIERFAPLSYTAKPIPWPSRLSRHSSRTEIRGSTSADAIASTRSEKDTLRDNRALADRVCNDWVYRRCTCWTQRERIGSLRALGRGVGELMNDIQWHPMMVHFPLALTLAGAACLICARLFKDETLQSSLAYAGTWNLILGAAAVLLTLGTGLAAVWHLALVDGAQYSVSRHMIWAVCSSQLVASLAMYRVLAVTWSSVPGAWFLVFLGIACAGLMVTGYYGGENVYHYALGVTKG